MARTADQKTFFDPLYPVLRAGPGLDNPGFNDAWRKFWDHYSPQVRGWARQQGLRDDQIDEITPRVMARLVEVMPKFQYDPERGFSPWLRTVVNNIINDFWASLVRHPGANPQGGSSAALRLDAMPDSDAAADSLGLVVETAMREFLAEVAREAEELVRSKVKPATWDAYELIEKQKLPGKEVAAKTGLTVAAAFMARGRVKQMVDDEIVRLGKLRK